MTFGKRILGVISKEMSPKKKGMFEKNARFRGKKMGPFIRCLEVAPRGGPGNKNAIFN